MRLHLGHAIEAQNGSEAVKMHVTALRGAGYDGPLTLATFHAPSQCYVLRLLAFKNMRAQGDVQQALGGFRCVLSRPVSTLLRFFDEVLRPLLVREEDEHPFVFIQVLGQRRGQWFDARRDDFGRYCGESQGLNLKTSVRTLRHVITTEAVRYVLDKYVLCFC